MNIAAILEDQARRHRDRPAIVERRRRISFAELNQSAAAAAAELAAAGVRPGMRALVFSPMSVDLYVVLIALFRLRAAAVFVDPSAGRPQMNRCVARVRPHAFVAVPRAHWLRVLSPEVRAIRIKAAIGGRVPGAAPVRGRSGRPWPVEAAGADDAAIITFTSGSTGEPKAAVRTHGFLVAQHRVLAESLALEPGEVDLCTLPIFLLANLASGVTSVIPDADLRAPGRIDPAPVVRQIAESAVTRTAGSPALLARIAAHAAAAGRPLMSLRRVYTGGAPVFPRLLDALRRGAPDAAVVAVYGSTEAEPIAEIDRREIGAGDRAAMAGGRGLLTGAPVSSILLRIVPDRWGTPVGPVSEEAFAASALPAGEAGEIVVSGDHVLRGYLDGVGDSETKIQAGSRVWHRTGDAGYLDAAGRLWLLGRCAAKVVDAGGVTYPFAVECAASEVEGVVRTAFVCHRDRRLLVAEVQGDAAAVRRALADAISWARLDDVVIVPRIPVDRRHNAKVEYPALRRMLDRG